MRIGVLTGGGDCPGINAVIRAVVRTTEERHGGNVIGYRHGWSGVVEGASVELTAASTHALLAAGGTVLGTSRYHPADHPGATQRALNTLAHDHVDALLVVGGDGSLGAAMPFLERGITLVAIPKTIDNDVACTDRSVGFDTAVSIATEAIDRIHTTAESHDRLMVVEVMGHHTGWLAVAAGLAGGAHIILVPEVPVDVEEVSSALRHRHQRESFSIVVAAEGAWLDERPADDSLRASTEPVQSGLIGTRLRDELAERTGFETRLVVLGHVQRGGPPTPTDRLLATRFGVAAVDALHSGRAGVMTALCGDEVRLVDLRDAVGPPRPVPDSWLETTRAFLV